MTGLDDLAASIGLAEEEGSVRVSAVVLAAGMSRRMGEAPKLLLDVGGVPMIRRTVENVVAFAPAETVVVTGHRAAEIEQALAGLPVRCVHNPRHQEGQPTSVAAGVGALTAHCNAVMVVLGDQPLVTADDMRALVAAYEALDAESILVPHHAGQRGNPVIFAARHIPAVIGGGLNVGCRHLIDSHAVQVARTEFASDVYTLDCDTPDDYRRLIERSRGR